MSGLFQLDPRLGADSVQVAEFGLSALRLMNDARFPWLILVPRRAAAADIIDLDEGDRAILMEEIATVSSALKAVTACDKLNVAALGNLVRQLHVHVIARFKTDAAWPNPVWGSGKAVAYQPAERDRLIERIRSLLSA